MTKSDDRKPAPPEDDRFVEKARGLFEDSVERLDAATLSKLNQGRHRALEELERSRSRQPWLTLAPAGGIAAAAVVAVLMMQGPAGVDLPEMNDTSATDFEILLGDDSLEMIEELEFYSWLDAADLDAAENVG